MERSDVLRTFASAAALAVLPRNVALAWSKVASAAAPLDGMSSAQMALVSAIADTILPRADTPGALDVRVPDFVNVIVTEYAEDEERTAFYGALDGIDAKAKELKGSASDVEAAADRGAVLDAIEAIADRETEPARSYWRLKGLVVHGYLTSETVMQDVLEIPVMPGRFEGSAPLPARKRPLQAGHVHD